MSIDRTEQCLDFGTRQEGDRSLVLALARYGGKRCGGGTLWGTIAL